MSLTHPFFAICSTGSVTKILAPKSRVASCGLRVRPILLDSKANYSHPHSSINVCRYGLSSYFLSCG